MTHTRAITTSWSLLLLLVPAQPAGADGDEARGGEGGAGLDSVDWGRASAAVNVDRGEASLLPGAPSGPDDLSDPQPEWRPPDCSEVAGTGAVTFSFDDGATLAPMDRDLRPVTYTFGLVALGEPGALLAGSGRQILASDDAGCSWRSLGPADGANAPALTLRAAGDARAYAYGGNDSALLRVDDHTIHALSSPTGKAGIVGLGVDPDDPDHVRIGDSRGQLWDSRDAGETWDPLGAPATGGALAYRAAFDPQDIDHVVFGALSEGVLVSRRAGQSWRRATGLGGGAVNAFNVVISPAEGDVVWVMGLDLEQASEAKARRIFRSDDGGRSFEPVVEAHEAKLYNGNHMFPHPGDPDVLYFVFGSNFGNYGTDLYRYDYGRDALTSTHNRWHDTVIEFSPGDPTVMYLGLSIEPGGGDMPPPIGLPSAAPEAAPPAPPR